MNKRQTAFLNRHKLCRLATASKDCVPHVIPVMYALDRDRIVVAIDYKTRKLSNMRANPNVSIVVDDFDPNRAVFVQGKVAIFERGREYLRLLKVLYKKFEVYRKNPWQEGESPIISITPTKVVSWGV
jgi:PPOX class probable F420-dependent enzyme